MMDESLIEFYVEVSKPLVNVIVEDLAQNSTHLIKIRPLTIFYEEKEKLAEDKMLAKITIEVHKPFPYKSDKAVPWNYNCNMQVSNMGKWATAP